MNSFNEHIDSELDQRLSMLRREMELHETPASIETNLLAAALRHVKLQQKQRWQEKLAHWFAPGLGLATSVGMAAWMTLMPMQHAVTDAPMTAPFDTTSPFIALDSLENIASETKPRLIETQVPRMWLANYGVPVNPETASEKISAEMLVSTSGRPLAVRFTP
jgi:hypothetical protein